MIGERGGDVSVTSDGLVVELLAAEGAARDGSSFEPSDATDVGGATTPTPLTTSARRLGLTARLLLLGRRALATDTDSQGGRFLLAEVSVDFLSARELVYNADPSDAFEVGLAAVATRDTLREALVRIGQLATPDQWEEFVAVRTLAEDELRRDPAGAADLEVVAATALDARRGLMWLDEEESLRA